MTRRTALRSTPDTTAGLLGHHEVLRRHLPGEALPWLAELRRAALARFRSHGLPGRQDEAWRYTSLAHLGEITFTPALLSPEAEVHDLPTAILPLDGCRLVLVNGGVDRMLCDARHLPQGVTVQSLTKALSSHPERLQPWLGTAPEDSPLAALNTASFTDGVVVHVAAGTVMEAPLHVISVGVGVDHAVDFHPRLLVVLEEGARFSLAESHCGIIDQPYLSNGVVEIHLGRNAHLRHVKLQDEAPLGWHIASHAASLAEGASYHVTVLHTGGRLARHEARLRLLGRHAEVRADGAVLVDGDGHMDNTITIKHDTTDGVSRQVWKSVVGGRGRSVFQGKVAVARDAQRTDAHQLARALLLSPHAEADAKPELEIYADDVKCGHGSSVGALDEAQLFYLESRGIDPEASRRMLIEAFVGEVLARIEDGKVREAMQAVARRRLAGM